MIPVLTIIDDFLPAQRFHEIRAEVIRRGFQTEMVKEGEGLPEVKYENVQMQWMPSDFGTGLPYVFGRKVHLHQQAFRLGTQHSQLHNLVHADHCCSSLAAVYYLNELPQCQGGTAFWRHKRFGWEMQPTQEELDAYGYSIDELSNDWHDHNAWEMVTLAGMAPNRLITYPTNAFHSRWPWEGFGTTPENGRLIWCGFFDLV